MGSTLNDLRELPTYGIAEVAYYLQIPDTTSANSLEHYADAPCLII
jgi:hypothetical protein